MAKQSETYEKLEQTFMKLIEEKSEFTFCGNKMDLDASNNNSQFSHSNSFFTDYMNAFIEAVNNSANLQKLSITNIDSPAIQKLAKVLRTNSSITSLNLQGNKIDYDAATALAKMLKHNKFLSELNLNNTSIGDSEIVILSNTLTNISSNTNHSLTSIDLRNNSITNDGVLALTIMVKYNSRITEIKVTDTGIKPEYLNGLNNALINNKNCCFIKGESFDTSFQDPPKIPSDNSIQELSESSQQLELIGEEGLQT